MTRQITTLVLPVSYRFAATLCICLQVACSHMETPVNLSDVLPPSTGFAPRLLSLGGITLAAAQKGVSPSANLHVYIEGDGRAYISNGVPAANPTPLNPVGLNLAREDAAPAVLYLARPCQFVSPLPPECRDHTLSTARRWSPEVVDAYVRAIAPLAAPGHPVTLTGYSGGAYIALAVASRLPEGSVARLSTVAGNLLPDAVNAAHGIPPESALAPLDFAKLAAIPQTHHVGGGDKVIPASLKDAYIAAAGPAGASAVAAGRWEWIETSSATHGEGWNSIAP